MGASRGPAALQHEYTCLGRAIPPATRANTLLRSSAQHEYRSLVRCGCYRAAQGLQAREERLKRGARGPSCACTRVRNAGRPPRCGNSSEKLATTESDDIEETRLVRWRCSEGRGESGAGAQPHRIVIFFLIPPPPFSADSGESDIA